MKKLHNWVRKQWKNVSFGDHRLNSRAEVIAQACARHPDRSIPKRFQDWASTKAAYRFLNSEKVCHRKIQQPHYANVRQEAVNSQTPILFIQDGSELLFNSHRYTFGLGPTADACGNGLLFHSCLAARYHGQDSPPEVLGLAHQTAWVRPENGEKSEFKESAVWLNALKEIGLPPKEREWITIGDRGSDIHHFLSGACEQGWKFVVRAKHNRHIQVKGESKRLFPWVRSLTGKVSRTILVRARGEEFSGEVTLSISWGKAKIKPPASSSAQWEEEMSFIRVHAPENPKIEWVLISNIGIDEAEDAIRLVELYRQRWLIEEYHKCLKTGCRIELSQLQQGRRIINLLGILGVIATQLLALKEKGRLEPSGDAGKVVAKDMYQVVCRHFKLSKPTIREFWRCVARLGGFLARNSDGDPGWQAIWSGMSRINDMLLGYKILSALK